MAKRTHLASGTLKKKFERLIFPTKYVIPKSLKFSQWPSKKSQELQKDPGVPPPSGVFMDKEISSFK